MNISPFSTSFMGRPESPKPFFKGSWWLNLIIMILSQEKLFQKGKASVVKCLLNSTRFPGEDGLGGCEHVYNLFHSKEVIQSSKGPWTRHPQLLSGHTLTGCYDGLITIHNQVGGEWRGKNLDPTCLFFEDREQNPKEEVKRGTKDLLLVFLCWQNICPDQAEDTEVHWLSSHNREFWQHG